MLRCPQRCVPQDTGFSSRFLKVLVQTLQWLDSPAVEAGPLQAQLKLFAAQYSARRRISDGETGSMAPAGVLGSLPSRQGDQGLVPRGVPGGVGVSGAQRFGGRGTGEAPQRGAYVWEPRGVACPAPLAGVPWVTRRSPAVRSGFLHLAEALTFRGDPEVVSSTIRAITATLKSGEGCDVEPELISKGTRAPGATKTPPRHPAHRSLSWAPPEQGLGAGLSVLESGGPLSWSDTGALSAPLSPPGSGRREVASPGGAAGRALLRGLRLPGLGARGRGELTAAAGEGGAPGPGEAGL